ncbi:hypothetical protein [uncultured Neptuniibacter sp.]
MSILFITHDLGLVKEFSDQVCVMQNGWMSTHYPPGNGWNITR